MEMWMGPIFMSLLVPRVTDSTRNVQRGFRDSRSRSRCLARSSL
jgi:hypothetical protein